MDTLPVADPPPLLSICCGFCNDVDFVFGKANAEGGGTNLFELLLGVIEGEVLFDIFRPANGKKIV